MDTTYIEYGLSISIAAIVTGAIVVSFLLTNGRATKLFGIITGKPVVCFRNGMSFTYGIAWKSEDGLWYVYSYNIKIPVKPNTLYEMTPVLNCKSNGLQFNYK